MKDHEMMREDAISGGWAVSLTGLVLVLAGAATLWADEADTAADLWSRMRRAEVASAELKAVQRKLAALIDAMPVTKRTAAATAMMDRRAERGVNAEAMRSFGADPLPITDIQRILWDSGRSYPQRLLLKTYYSLCRGKDRASALSETTRRQLVDVLAERLDNLAGTKVAYGEQRLLTHLCSSLLSRCGGGARGSPQARGLIKSLEKYAEKARKGDGFGAAIPAWLDLAKSKDVTADTFGKAVQALGHWDPLVRLRAVCRLGERDVPADDRAAQVVLALLSDPRDEVRAGAAQVFAVAKDYRPNVVVPKMVELLTRDRGVVVQAAAEEVLIARRDQAAGQIDALLAVMKDPTRRLGARRTSHILLVLSKFVGVAKLPQKESMLVLAARNLTRSPDGSLAVMQALGPQAARAVPSIREYRATVDRLRRAQIDRHVLPAILPNAPVAP